MGVLDYVYNPQSLNTQGATSPVVQTRGYAPEVLKLAGQLTKQRAAAGVGAPKQSPGLMQRIFDVIQRPLYTTANAVDYAVKGDNPLEGAWRGLSGQDKTSYDQVLGDMGMSGGWQRSLLGFGLDIALDPTTYVGAGIEKNVAEGLARKTAIEGSADAIAEAAGKSAIKDTAENIIKENTVKGATQTEASRVARLQHFMGYEIPETATKEPTVEAVMKGAPEKVFPDIQNVGKKEAMQMASDIHTGNALDAIHQATDAELAKQRGKVYLKYMGKQTPIASEKLYTVGSKLGEIANKSKFINTLNTTFRPSALYPQGLNDLIRREKSAGVFKVDRDINILSHLFGDSPTKFGEEVWGGLTKGERESIMAAKSAGRTIEGVSSTGRPLQEYLNYLTHHGENAWGVQRDLGLVNPEDWKPNHVPMILQGGTPAEQKAFKAGVRKGLPGHTIEDAEAKGLKPVMDPMEAYGQQGIKEEQTIVPARMNRAAAQEFGVDLGSLAPGDVLNSTGKKIANDLGLKGVKLPGMETKTWFPAEVADALTSANKKIADPEYAKGMLHYFDKAQQAWKLNMTAVNPGHHVRNFMGDVFLNHEAGVHNPKFYNYSAKILNNWRKNPDSFKLTFGNLELNSRQLMDLFGDAGGKSGFFRQEYAQTTKGFGSVAAHPVEKIRELAETREDWTRMANFLDYMDKHGGDIKSFQDARNVAQDAVKRVRKYNIDYGDLTPFEQKFMKRIVPFYTWMRKNIPLQIETMALDPGKVSVVPKGLRALQNITGASPDETQVLGLNIVPQWIRDMAGVRIAGEGLGRNQVYWNPAGGQIPFMDIGQYFNGSPADIVRQFASGITPLARIPIEQATGRMLNSGAPVDSMGNYYAGNILPPSVPALKSIITGAGQPTDVGKLVGLSLANVGPQQQLGELRRQQDPIQAILRARKQRPRSWEPGYGQPAK